MLVTKYKSHHNSPYFQIDFRFMFILSNLCWTWSKIASVLRLTIMVLFIKPHTKNSIVYLLLWMLWFISRNFMRSKGDFQRRQHRSSRLRSRLAWRISGLIHGVCGSLDNSFGSDWDMDVENGFEGGGKLICKVIYPYILKLEELKNT